MHSQFNILFNFTLHNGRPHRSGHRHRRRRTIAHRSYGFRSRTVQKISSKKLCQAGTLKIGLLLSPYTGQKFLTLHQSQTYVVFEESFFIVNSIQRLFIFNINSHTIAVHNVGFVESNFSLCGFQNFAQNVVYCRFK